MAKGQIWVSPRGNNHNSGSSSSPLKNIQAALNKAPDGTDVMVKAGIYTENLRLYHSNISLISADGHHDATIRPASQNSSTIAGFGVEGTTIRGFVIDGANNANAIHFGIAGI
jgi:pectin methylesterase-like acyl-CoA thioesterase